mgnify:CR=1 FL=1
MKVSIVIPAFNEGKTIIQILDKIHLAKKLINHEFEIVIVNDGSTDDTKDKLTKHKHLYDQLVDVETIQHFLYRDFPDDLNKPKLTEKQKSYTIDDVVQATKNIDPDLWKNK